MEIGVESVASVRTKLFGIPHVNTYSTLLQFFGVVFLRLPLPVSCFPCFRYIQEILLNIFGYRPLHTSRKPTADLGYCPPDSYFHPLGPIETRLLRLFRVPRL